MSDLFHEAVPADFVKRVWSVMMETPRHTYQILTKRPDRMGEIVATLPKLNNVWLGTSVENADYLNRVDDLRRVPAAVRFISFEPLIGSVAGANLDHIHWAIVGGESGPRARPMLELWVDEIEAICRRNGTAFFFKQWGGKNKKATGRSYRGDTYDELPNLGSMSLLRRVAWRYSPERENRNHTSIASVSAIAWSVAHSTSMP
jgi:protein gp37